MVRTYNNITKDERQQYISKYLFHVYLHTVKHLGPIKLDLHTMNLNSTWLFIASLLAPWAEGNGRNKPTLYISLSFIVNQISQKWSTWHGKSTKYFHSNNLLSDKTWPIIGSSHINRIKIYSVLSPSNGYAHIEPLGKEKHCRIYPDHVIIFS